MHAYRCRRRCFRRCIVLALLRLLITYISEPSLPAVLRGFAWDPGAERVYRDGVRRGGGVRGVQKRRGVLFGAPGSIGDDPARGKKGERQCGGTGVRHRRVVAPRGGGARGRSAEHSDIFVPHCRPGALCVVRRRRGGRRDWEAH